MYTVVVSCEKTDLLWPTLATLSAQLSNSFFGLAHRRYGNSTIQTLLSAKEGPSQGGSSQRITIVPPLSAAWFSDIVIPAVIVSIVVVVSLFAIVVLLLLRRHIQLEGHEGESPLDSCFHRYTYLKEYLILGVYHREHDDRNALTPGSVRRQSPPLGSLRPPDPLVSSASQRPNNHHNGGIVMHVDLERQQHHHTGVVGHSSQRGEELFLC